MMARAPAGRRRWRWALAVGAIVVLGVVLAGLYRRAEAVAPRAHFDYTLHLRGLREADAEINVEVLASRLELSRNFDGLTADLRRATQIGQQLATVPDFLPEADRAALTAAVANLRATMAEKARLIEVFKRQNAVLRNSLAYFPIAADEFLARNGGPVGRAVEAYVRYVLSYARTPDPDRLAQVSTAAERLAGLTSHADQGLPVDNLLRHGNVIAATVAEVDGLTQDILKLEGARQLEKLNQIYARGYDNAVRRAAHYRRVLYALALGLAAYLAFTFMRLDRARQSLAKANRELAARYTAQLQAEELLRLHATAFDNSHEGITLTDASGAILDVNPAFTRITGYERSEVIGRNPRVLKSGHHDRDFYAAMWKSITEMGSWRGEIWNRGKFGDLYPELLSIAAVRDATGKLTNYVAVFADISRLKEQEKQLTQMAYFDALTELPNRVLLADRIVQASSQSRRSETLMAVCYLDLDGFKLVNDTWGHEVGDQLLVEMARRLKDCLRGGDTVARLGGDEFVLLLLGLATEDECEKGVQRLLHAVGQPLLVAPQPVVLSASIGVAIYPLDDGDPDTLLRHADQAMYQAKQSGKNCYHLFDPDEDRYARSRHDRVTRIQEALDRGEFVLHYQPKVDMRAGQVTGAEALVRWQHPERGLLVPEEFLPLIEDHELIVRLGDWVIETALQRMADWRRAGLDLSVSVNVAGRQLQDAGFVQRLSEALARHREVGRRLEMEVLETTALEDMVKVSRVIEECAALGVSFALDDFGTGYSSLTYLKRLPTASIKIDQSFVREILSDPNNLVIVQGVIGLARAFQRRAIAEGVETVEHGRLLLQLDCDYAQGYGIARPMPGEQMVDWVRDWRPDPAWTAVADLRWELADYALLIAEVEHRNWVAQLVFAIKEGQPLPHRQLDDPRGCHFGVWYYGSVAAERYRLAPAYGEIEAEHGRLHEIAGEIDRLARDGAAVQARARLGDLLAQRDRWLAKMRELQLQLAKAR
jgi:diguanylate cyclase (GGDEF)-like protein/PAS domain S-box-containing protein